MADRGRQGWDAFPAEPTTVGPQTPDTRPADPPPPRRRGGLRGRGRLVRRVLAGLLALLLLHAVALLAYVGTHVDHLDALAAYDGRPAATPGQDWLLVGSDSRAGLSSAERRRLTTGGSAGQRTDTIILLHVPDGGDRPTLVSIPRDSYVPIPGHGRNKINAAYAIGGPRLLVQTVETVTGIRIDHYVSIGFGGFVGVVEAVGGVRLCPPRAMKDVKAGLDVQAGCQSMDGATALGYVRARYSDPLGDLGRVQRQQQFLSAVFGRATSPAVLVNPVAQWRLARSGTQALATDGGTGVVDLARFGLVMRRIAHGDGTTTTVPVADPGLSTPVGSAVKWDTDKALALFRSLRQR
jgi:LCP family protein required for cell wall assembly